MRPQDRNLAIELDDGLTSFEQEVDELLGIHNPAYRNVLLEQLVESVRRVKFVSVIRGRDLSERRADPNDDMFDPIRAAIVFQRAGMIDEAYWMVFMFVHFGRHSTGGYRYAREVYGRLGGDGRWDWACTSANCEEFRDWLDDHQDQLRRPGVPGGFGNHRKYESLDARSPNGTGAVVDSYVRWVEPLKTHHELVNNALEKAGGDPRQAFNALYWSMGNIVRFGRTARFDYLTMVGKLGLAPIEPYSTYMQGATGPRAGAKLLFGGSKTAALNTPDMDARLLQIGQHLGVGMQVLEDALCNWQKSPAVFIRFRG